MELRMGLTSGKMEAVDVWLWFADWSRSVWSDSKADQSKALCSRKSPEREQQA